MSTPIDKQVVADAIADAESWIDKSYGDERAQTLAAMACAKALFVVIDQLERIEERLTSVEETIRSD